MNIFIDATNIKAGGGLIHLKKIVEYYDADENDTLTLIGGNWLNKIEDRKWIKKRIFAEVFKSFLKQELFKKYKLHKILNEGEIAFIPGGTFSSKKIPYVTMPQNMLVFENKERNRFPKSFTWLRYHLLEKLQTRSLRASKGIIYISHYAKNYIENKYPDLKGKHSTVIYHGISDNFRQVPKKQQPIESYTNNKPFKILYVSIINFYKHQWNVVDVVKRIREEGFFIELELIGPMYEPARVIFEKSLEGTSGYVNYSGKVEHDQIVDKYKSCDLFLFASTCENMPNIVVEAMSAGLPILSSSYGPMPEIIKDGGVYMDPTNKETIYLELKKLLVDFKVRSEIAEKAYSYSKEFSWTEASNETMSFIKKTATL